MSVPAEPTPAAFGSALRAAREDAGVTLEAIAERTKIAHAVLAGLEAGDFSRLPGGVFPRLFLRQYLDLIHAEPDPWLDAFERARGAAAQHRGPAALPTNSAAPQRPRLTPWLIGLGLVVAAFAALVLIDRGGAPPAAGPVTPTIAALLLAPTPPPVEPTAAPTPDPGILTIRALERACWVELQVEGENPESRLVEAGGVWQVEAGGRAVRVKLGDAGAVELDYLGGVRRELGADGAVVRLSLGPAATP